MTTTIKTNGEVKRPVKRAPRKASASKEFASVDKLVDLLTQAVQQWLQTETVDAAELTRLRDENAALRDDFVEINRLLVYYAGTQGWCSTFEFVFARWNPRLKSGFKFKGRVSEYDSTKSRHPEVEILENDKTWAPPQHCY